MATQKPLVIDGGTQKDLPSADQLEVNAGTAALPAVTIAGDPNTGIYSPGADQIAISTAGTQRVTVDANGLLTTAADASINGVVVGRGGGNVSTNTVVGPLAGTTITSGSNLTCIGNDAEPSSATATNQITLGNSAVTTFRIGTAATANPGLGQAGFSAQNLTGSPNQTKLVIAHSAQSNGAPFIQFWVNGSNGTGAAITQAAGPGGTGFAILYSNGSDYRLKKNIETMDTVDALDRVLSLRPVLFHYKQQGDGPHDDGRLIEGFIAHEVQAVVPQAVTHSKDAVDAEGNPQYQGFDQAHLVPVLTAACQQLHAKNQQLEARLAALEAAFAQSITPNG